MAGIAATALFFCVAYTRSQPAGQLFGSGPYFPSRRSPWDNGPADTEPDPPATHRP